MYILWQDNVIVIVIVVQIHVVIIVVVEVAIAANNTYINNSVYI